jgi:VanZ family protein
MIKLFAFFRRWGVSILLMLAIVAFSSIPSKEMPYFSWADLIVKKGGHMLGYGLLALSYSYGLRGNNKQWWLSWLLAVLFAITDEIHQSSVPGRHSSIVDVCIDSIGAGLALLIKYVLYIPNLRSQKSLLLKDE